MEPLPDEARNAAEGVPYKIPNDAEGVRYNHFHWIMVGLLLWGGYLAIGVVQTGGNHASIRGFIVFGCVLAFLGFWLAALAVRQRRLRREAEGEREA